MSGYHCKHNFLFLAVATSLYYVALPLPYSAMFFSTLLYSTLLYSVILYSTRLCYTLLCSTLIYSTLLYSVIIYSTLHCYTLLYSALLYSMLLYSTIFRGHQSPSATQSFYKQCNCSSVDLSVSSEDPLLLISRTVGQ